MTFFLKTDTKLSDTVIVTLGNDDGAFLILGYNTNKGMFYLRGSDGVIIWADDVTGSERDWICFGISQSADTRILFIYSLQNDKYTSAEAEAAPVGAFTTLYGYPKVL